MTFAELSFWLDQELDPDQNSSSEKDLVSKWSSGLDWNEWPGLCSKKFNCSQGMPLQYQTQAYSHSAHMVLPPRKKEKGNQNSQNPSSDEVDTSMFHKDPSSMNRQSNENNQENMEDYNEKQPPVEDINQDILRAIDSVDERRKIYRQNPSRVP